MKKQSSYLLIFCACGLSSLLVGMLFPIGGTTERLILYAGYPYVLLCTLVFAISLVKELKGIHLVRAITCNRWHLFAILLTTVWVLSVEPFMFKIISDELIISSNAQMLHMERIPSIAISANWSSGDFQVTDSFLGKRPFLLPFLVSILHDLTGYRLENIFIVNSCLVFVFLGLGFAFVKSISGLKSAYFFLILIAFVPVFLQGATSGNASILNLTLLAANMVLAKRYFDDPSPGKLVPLVYGLILLSQARYESIIYVVVFGMLILAGWKKAGKIILSPAIIISPVFLVLNLIHLRYSMANKGVYWQPGPDNREDTFSFSYVLENLQTNWEFLFHPGRDYSNSLILSIAGMAGLAICLLYFKRKNITFRYPELLLLVLGLLLANALVLLHFNYGVFTKYSTSRLSLPMSFFLAIFAAMAFRLKPKEFIMGSLLIYSFIFYIQTLDYTKTLWLQSGWAQALCCLTCVAAGIYFVSQKKINRLSFVFAMLALSIVTISPKLHSRPYFWNYETHLIVEKFKEFLEEEASKDTLFVTRVQLVPILMNHNSIIPAEFINVRINAVEAMEKDHYKNIYLVTTESESLPYPLNMDIGEYNKLVPEFKFEKYKKERVLPDLFLTVHKLSPTDE